MAKDHRGKCGLMFHTSGDNGRMQRIIAHNIKVSSSKSFLNEVRGICGKKNVWISEWKNINIIAWTEKLEF